MKQTACALLAAAFLFLTACAAPAPPVSQSPPPPDPITEPTEEQNSPDTALPKVPIAGDLRTDVDFLTAEQWALYDKGMSFLSSFIISPGYFTEDHNTVFNQSKKINEWYYCPYISARYSNYNDFYNDVLTVYTPDLFETLNHMITSRSGSDSPTYMDVDGALYYLDVASGANLTRLWDRERYELVSKDEERIEFDVIAYYCEHDDVSLENPVPVEMKRGPIVMEKTEDGWRISKLDDPSYLERIGGYDTDINPD